MPNHIQNRLQIIGSKKQVAQLRQFVAGKTGDGIEMQMDFSKIKPMVESLMITSGSLGETAHRLLFGTKKEKFFFQSDDELKQRMVQMSLENRKEAVELALQYQSNLEQHGATTWYDWCIENWGTKWNAYSQNDKRNTADTIFFQTAWSAPIELMQELSKMFPEISLILTYADEDSGSNTGRLVMRNGTIVESCQPESKSRAGYDLYFELHPGSRRNYKIVDGHYVYVEEPETVNPSDN